MLATAAAICSAVVRSRLKAVVTTPVPSGLVRISLVPRRAPPLVSMRRGSTMPSTTRPYLGSLSWRVWPPAMTTPASIGLVRAAGQDLAHHLVGQVRGKGRDVQREQRPAAHGVDVAQGVGGRDSAVGGRVVHDGREEVDGRDQRLVVAQPVDGSIVRPAQAHEQVGIVLRLEQAGERAQHVRQGLRGHLGRSASAGSQTGQADWVTVGFVMDYAINTALAGAPSAPVILSGKQQS